MSKLTSMKLSETELKKRSEPMASPEIDTPVYPWGLQVRLDEQSLDKLGLDTLPKVDSERLLIAKVRVVSVSSNEHSGDKGKHKHKSVELQICEMALEDVPADKDAAGELYGKS